MFSKNNKLIGSAVSFGIFVWNIFIFSILLSLYLAISLISFVIRYSFLSPKLKEKFFYKMFLGYEKISAKIDPREDGIKKSELIELSIRNMKIKKTRTLVTIGGMMIGVGAIVFLVSIGYGLQGLVLSRVAKLEEMKQADVLIPAGSKLAINDQTLADFSAIPHVKAALPLIVAVGQVNLNDSVFNMAAYGVTSQYLQESDMKPVAGSIFNNNDMSVPVSSDTQDTAVSNLEKEAVVNESMLQVLNLKDNEAVGKTFSVSFALTSDLKSNGGSEGSSTPSDYVIKGVISEGKTPLFYVPFVNIRSLGVNNFSQVKIVADSQDSLASVRKQVESMGYDTHSTTDTVNQIVSLFSTIRLVLTLVGMIALAVAALGMFNTLTVSLLERTREVGLMKAMGMKSKEVEELFLTESMIMGFSGGLLGILAGFIGGKILSLIFTFVAMYKKLGLGFLNVASVPFSLVFIILFASLLVGVITGIFPAKRAEKISALDALRYE